MPNITISDLNYRRLQAFARPFEDTVDDAVARILDLAERHPDRSEQDRTRPEAKPVFAGSDLITSRGRIPHGVRLRTRYKGREYYAEIRDGAVLFEREQFSSLSSAAVGVIRSTGSDRPTENGWRFWEFYDPETGRWQSAEKLKKESVVERLRRAFGAQAA